MARNRVIYQSEALYVGQDASLLAAVNHNQIERTQSANFSYTINRQDINQFGRSIFRREIISLHKTKGTVNFEETKQLFLNNVLTEALDDGTPAYYNSNILGRYMRKDYGNFGTDSPTNT